MELIVMPAITVDNPLVLPHISRPDPAASTPRPVSQVVTAHSQIEGAGFAIRRPFPGGLPLAEADPFLLLDHMGPQINAPGEARRGTLTAASRPSPTSSTARSPTTTPTAAAA
jgi:hypothetical protein